MASMLRPSADRPRERALGAAPMASPCSRPEELLAKAFREAPELTGRGRSGISAAVWGHTADSVTEYRRGPLADFHVLTVRLGEFRGDRWIDGQPVANGEGGKGSSCLSPAGSEVRGRIHGPWRALQLYLPCSLLKQTAEETELPRFDPCRLDVAQAFDPILYATCEAVLAEIAEERPGSHLQIDTLGTLVCVHLLRRSARSVVPRRTVRGGLAGWQLRRALDCIEERLDESVTLTLLAGEVGLSSYHFARAFKQSTGQSPHHYLLQCRLARAKELLARTDCSVAEIAARVGYGDPTQLARLFQSALAISPSAYRASFGGPARSPS